MHAYRLWCLLFKQLLHSRQLLCCSKVAVACASAVSHFIAFAVCCVCIAAAAAAAAAAHAEHIRQVLSSMKGAGHKPVASSRAVLACSAHKTAADNPQQCCCFPNLLLALPLLLQLSLPSLLG
jgi:hypothetical protein